MVFPRLIDFKERISDVGIMRQRVAEAALGHVLELGGENGANLFLYPRSITSLTSLTAIRAVPQGTRRSSRQLPFPVDRRSGYLNAFPLKNHAYDTVVSTFALAAANNLAQTLREIKRVLKPGGRLLFLEFGRSPDASVARWQRRCAPLLRVLSGARQPLQDIDGEIVTGGFSLKHLECGYLIRLPRALGCVCEGVAFNDP